MAMPSLNPIAQIMPGNKMNTSEHPLKAVTSLRRVELRVYKVKAFSVLHQLEAHPQHVSQGPSYGYAAPTPAPAPAKYDFNYAVKDEYSGNDFGHQEARDGYDTQGSYYVQLPDGRLQKVTYTVNGDSGFVAEVSYEGEAQYPAEQPAYKPAPSYA
ncbi:cuticle protein 18.6-like [Penaeus indicus]|uniref:cuticle protein 18.6-like n=1 Tax=Penaeus indicus TaxID=29960 RepID=UPI00300C6252